MIFTGKSGIKDFKKYINKKVDNLEKLDSKFLANNIRNSAYKNTMMGKDIDGKTFASLKFRKGQPLMDSGKMLNSMLVSNQKNSSLIYIAGKFQRMKARTHNNGAVIRPKKGNFLTFKSNGIWMRMKEARIPKREFFPRANSKLVKKEVDFFNKLVEKTFTK